MPLKTGRVNAQILNTSFPKLLVAIVEMAERVPSAERAVL